MFTPLIKRLLWPLGLLLLFTPNFSAAQPEDDSTFNGIDYYFGRIVRGFGGGFQQLVGDKENGRRPFNTTPFLYGSLGSRLGFRLSNSTYWTESEDGAAPLDVFAKNTVQFTSAQATYRPASGLWLQGTGEFLREKWEGAQINKYKNNNFAYGLQGVYLSDGGNIRLAPAQLAYAYYALPFNAFMRNTAERPAIFLLPRQTMIQLTGNLWQRRFETKLTQLANAPFAQQQALSSDFSWANLELAYVLNRRLTFGFAAQPMREESQSHSSREDGQFQQTADRTSFNVVPWLDFLAARQVLHRFSGWYFFSDATSSSFASPPPSRTEFQGTFKSWQANYTLHYLGRVEAPSLEAFLADWNRVFGNRLPAHGLHLIGRAAMTSSQNANVRPGIIGADYFGPESKNRTYEISLAGLYGLADWLELGAKTDYSKNRDEETLDFSSGNSIHERSSRIHTITLSFANYRYEARHKERFGWEQIREFDRLHGPLLLGGMINGTVMAQYQTSSLHEDSQQFYVDSKSRYWIGEAQIRAGMTGKLELSLQGRLFKVSAVSGFEQTDNFFNVSLAWQPWESIRFRVGRGNLILNSDTGFLFDDNGAWNFQLMSLF
ncbi:MAG: hypothetical protein ACREOI_11480 [bacterium]